MYAQNLVGAQVEMRSLEVGCFPVLAVIAALYRTLPSTGAALRKVLL